MALSDRVRTHREPHTGATADRCSSRSLTRSVEKKKLKKKKLNGGKIKEEASGRSEIYRANSVKENKGGKRERQLHTLLTINRTL